MSCVLSKYYHKKKNNDEYELKAYGLDDEFHLDVDHYNTRSGWTNRTRMTLTPQQARELKAQLEEFIAQN